MFNDVEIEIVTINHLLQISMHITWIYASRKHWDLLKYVINLLLFIIIASVANKAEYIFLVNAFIEKKENKCHLSFYEINRKWLYLFSVKEDKCRWIKHKEKYFIYSI